MRMCVCVFNNGGGQVSHRGSGLTDRSQSPLPTHLPPTPPPKAEYSQWTEEHNNKNNNDINIGVMWNSGRQQTRLHQRTRKILWKPSRKSPILKQMANFPRFLSVTDKIQCNYNNKFLITIKVPSIDNEWDTGVQCVVSLFPLTY